LQEPAFWLRYLEAWLTYSSSFWRTILKALRSHLLQSTTSTVHTDSLAISISVLQLWPHLSSKPHGWYAHDHPNDRFWPSRTSEMVGPLKLTTQLERRLLQQLGTIHDYLRKEVHDVMRQGMYPFEVLSRQGCWWSNHREPNTQSLRSLYCITSTVRFPPYVSICTDELSS